MGFRELIDKEIADLPPEKQAAVLDFVTALKAGLDQTVVADHERESREVADALSAWRLKLADYRFDRDDANVR